MAHVHVSTFTKPRQASRLVFIDQVAFCHMIWQQQFRRSPEQGWKAVVKRRHRNPMKIMLCVLRDVNHTDGFK